MASVKRPVLVGQLSSHPLTTGEQHIRRLKITMHDAALMSEVDGTSEGRDELGGAVRGLRLAGEPFIQAAAIDVLQTEKGRAAVLADLMDLHDVRMRQASNRVGFGPEQGAMSQVGPEACQDHLQGHQSVQAALTR